MNVLLTSVGRRAYLVKYFKEAVNGNGKVFVSNSTKDSVAFKYADTSVVSPLIYDDNYIPFLLDFCKKNKIDVLISLFDIDLLVLAKNKESFQEIGTKVIVSNEDFIKICNDKWLTYKFLKNNKIDTPKTFLIIKDVLNCVNQGLLSYPIIVKPRFGCGSISICVAKNEEELRFYSKITTDNIKNSYLKYESSGSKNVLIYQECLSGQEYGADIINDLEGNNKNIILRKKIAMRSGETDIAEIVTDPLILSTLTKLSKCTKHIANLDCDLFLSDNKVYVLELNARFGGGYPFSHMAGCNLPLAILKWAKGEPVSKETLMAKIGFKGYKELVVTEI